MMSFNERSIFAFDGIGALFSALLTGVILPQYSAWIGLPASVLYGLALFPFLYAIYSLCCYWLVKKIKPWMLIVIVIANLFYCLVSGILIFLLKSLTFSGHVLLISEILIIFGVVVIELKVYRQVFRS